MARLVPALLALAVAAGPACDCGAAREAEPPASGQHSGGSAAGPYRSSYLVFLSDDAGDPLVVPVDVNWRAVSAGRMEVELKAWIGTPDGWSMRYEKTERPLEGPAPVDWWRVPALDGFAFAGDGTTVDVDVEGRSVDLRVPAFGDDGMVRERFAGGTVLTRADRTRITVAGEPREGYLLQERVELPPGAFAGGERPFDRFQYFPLVACDGLYLIEDRGHGHRHAARFRPGGQPAVAELARFPFAETRRGTDAESGRDDIPEAWRVELPEWGKRFTFHSTAHHTGHGPADADPRPVYRQASVTGTSEGERCTLHGMAELVLEDTGPPPALDSQPEVPHALSIASLAATRTTSRPAFVRLRVDNRTEALERVRLAAASAVADPPRDVEPSHVWVTPVDLGAIYSEAERTEQPVDEWIDVPAGEARLVEVWLRDDDGWSPFGRHLYELAFERDDGSPVHVEATLGDGVRDPVRR